uniref:hypothetical protein n=1 Tax=Alloprevotella sp. TaxID=1872471 RepID=UPI003FED870E
CLVSSLSHIARYAPSFTNPNMVQGESEDASLLVILAEPQPIFSKKKYTYDRVQIDLSELLEPPYIEYRDTDIPYKFKKNKEYEGISFCVYAKKNANNAFHNALFAHRTYIEMKKLSYIAEIHT